MITRPAYSSAITDEGEVELLHLEIPRHTHATPMAHTQAWHIPHHDSPTRWGQVGYAGALAPPPPAVHSKVWDSLGDAIKAREAYTGLADPANAERLDNQEKQVSLSLSLSFFLFPSFGSLSLSRSLFFWLSGFLAPTPKPSALPWRRIY